MVTRGERIDNWAKSYWLVEDEYVSFRVNVYIITSIHYRSAIEMRNLWQQSGLAQGHSRLTEVEKQIAVLGLVFTNPRQDGAVTPLAAIVRAVTGRASLRMPRNGSNSH